MTEWLEAMFKALDAMDAEAFTAHLGDAVLFRMGSAEPVVGRANVAAYVGRFFSSIQALRHQVTSVWQEPDAVICEGQVTYTRQDGRAVTLPFLNVLRMGDDLVSDYRVYIDPSPLFAA